MNISMGLPSFLAHGRDEELSWYRKIDEGPWHGLATSDLIANPHSWALSVQLAAAAAMTERVRLWTAITALPMRNAVLFAKELATVDILSGGRLTLGVGIGSQDEDYLAVGSDLAQRRQRMDEQIAVMRKVWAQEPPPGGHYPVGPKPLQSGGIPLVAGVMGPKSIARAARWATGVMDGGNSVSFSAEGLNSQRELVAQIWKESGRKENPHFSTSVFFALGADPKEQLAKCIFSISQSYGEEAARMAAETSTNYGAKGLREIVDSARSMGLDEIILMPSTTDPDEIDRARDVLGI
jgi:alkanesulfonate monooxygenase SsuD/methylene tetrahydromethanopterin reductase-like flavin-dependent oxidoreductase (luciferase family)